MFQLQVDYQPTIKDMMTVRGGIVEFNNNALDFESKSFAIFLKDEQDKIRGGVIAWFDIESTYVEILWVEEALRGQKHGTTLLRAAEKEAVKNGCRYSTLDTFEFQAEAFYLKNGYERLGEIKNYIRHYSRIFLRKKLTAE